MADSNYVIQQFNELLEEKKIKSINAAAKSMDVSSSSLSQYLRSQYTGDVIKLEGKVISFLQLIKERELSGDDEVVFLEGLKNTQDILNLTRKAHIRRTIGLITGRAGFGKSMALRSYWRRNTDAIYVEVDGAYNAKELLKELAINCNYNGTGHLNKLKKEIIEKLEGSGRFIIIDQAEYLPTKALDLLRTIHDKAGVGLLLSGLPVLLSNIKGVDGVHEQIFTRIGTTLQLEAPTDEDLKKQVRAYISSNNEIDEAFLKESRRNPRVLYILLRESKRIAKNKGIPINPDIVRIASRQLVK